MAPVAVSMSGHPTTTTQHQFEYPSAAAAASLPSPYTDPNHVSPNPLAQHMENWCYITDNAFDVLRHDIYSDPEFLALGSDFTDPKVQATVVDITNRCVRDFKRSVLEEIDSWRATLFSELKVEAPKRERPGELHEGGRAKKHKVNGSVDYDDEEEEDGEFVNSKNPGWQCLFFEHDPRAHPQCGQRRYKRVSELRRHIKTHTLPHHCETCGYRTAEERRLGSHKCDDGNKKKYQPVTAEDKVKHERLAKMGVKVGEMRLILFGDAANGHGRLSYLVGMQTLTPPRREPRRKCKLVCSIEFLGLWGPSGVDAYAPGIEWEYHGVELCDYKRECDDDDGVGDVLSNGG